MQSKSEKLAAAKKSAEAQKAKKKAIRDASKSTVSNSAPAGKKGKSVVPQSKAKKK